jgi:hypothetical protein
MGWLVCGLPEGMGMRAAQKYATEHAGFDYTRKDAEGAPDS